MDNREAIIKTIDKIAQLSKQPENEWLLRELRNKLGLYNVEFSSIDRNRIKEIHEYLSLDLEKEQIEAIAGYEYIESVSLREKLMSDWREMKRFRYGLVNRAVSYVDFCSHAHFQAEGIVNYYHYKINNGICDIDWFNLNIDEYNSNIVNKNFKVSQVKRETNGHPTTLDDVNYFTKKCVLFNQLKRQGVKPQKLTEMSMVLDGIRKIRNTEAVHRSPSIVEVPNTTYSFEAVEYALSELNSIVKQQIS